jgi:poly-gamma-glutamate capsule biosynthesis protein CapA/YwtB (metallophosphatase superfamily)
MSWRSNRYVRACLVELAIIAILVGVLLAKTRTVPLALDEAILEPAVVTRESSATLVFVGDMMFDRNIRKAIDREQDPLYPFARMRDELQRADLLIGNLEGPISARGTRQGSIYSFRFEPVGTMNALTDAGFDVLNLANNHIWDYGREAALDTMRHLSDAGIRYVGFGHDFAEANTPVVERIGDVTVALLGYTEFYSSTLWADDRLGLSEFIPEKITARIQDLRARGEADLVVISVHWGEEYEVRSNARQQKLARQLIDAGADLVIGHHPHVPQEVEQYNGGRPAGRQGWIAYSLGNFVFDQNFSPDTQRGLLLKVSLLGKSIEKVEPIEIRFTETFQPYVP